MYVMLVMSYNTKIISLHFGYEIYCIFLNVSPTPGALILGINYKLEITYGAQGDVSKQATPVQLSLLCGPNLQFILSESDLNRLQDCPRNLLFGSKDAL